MRPRDGGMPSRLMQAPDGFFYGIASRYGSGPSSGCGLINSCGTLFRIDTAGNFTVLHNFGTTDGPTPSGGLLLGKDGFFYGTTLSSIYRANKVGKVTTLHTFDPTTEGIELNGPLVEDDLGNFYGTALHGGHKGCHLASDFDETCGTVFKMDPAGNVTVLHYFGGDLFKPAAGLVLGSDGLLYGTTRGGAFTFFGGGVFKIDTAGNYSVAHTFNTAGYGPEGIEPWAGMLEAHNGSFYGANSLDGLPITSSDVKGTLIRMRANGKVTVLHTFKGVDGGLPLASLMQAQDGNLYGTTFNGGKSNLGTIFRLKPAPLRISSLNFDPATVPRGTRTTGTVTLRSPAPPGGLVVDLSNTNAALVTVPASITIPGGATSADFVGRAGSVFTGSVRIWASGPDGAGPSAVLQIGP
jgi:uncharacterized repeat protein (TIGR03803 family)